MTRKDHILRDVQLREQPHTLARPRLAMPPFAPVAGPLVPSAVASAALSAVVAAPMALAMPADAGAAHGAAERARVQAYEEGLARGREEGREAGRREGQAQAKEAAQRHAGEEGYREGLRQAQEYAQSHIQKAVDEAVEQAVKEAAARAREAEAGRLQRLDGLLAALPEQLERQLLAAEDDMLALAFEAVCRLLGEQGASVDGVRAQLHNALMAWRSRAPLRLHLHPDDLAALQGDMQDGLPRGEGLARTLRAFDGGADAQAPGVQWVADPEVVLGGCMLRSVDGGLDARLERQLETLKDVLLRTRAARRLPAAAVREAREE